jgi:hypothetical protein
MNGNSKMGVHGLYTLGASDIFGYLNNVIFVFEFSLNIVI